MSTGKVLLGVLAGIAAGAIAGVLLAPDKGSVTRKKIIKKGDDYTDELKNTFNEFIEGVTHKLEQAKDEASKMAEKASSRAE
jgi:gas vesicle protein